MLEITYAILSEVATIILKNAKEPNIATVFSRKGGSNRSS
jgi:hypothetical protein